MTADPGEAKNVLIGPSHVQSFSIFHYFHLRLFLWPACFFRPAVILYCDSSESAPMLASEKLGLECGISL